MKAQVRRPDGSAVEAVISNVDLDQEVVLRADGSRYTEAAAIADAEEISARRRAPGVGDDRSKVSQDAHHRSGCVSQTISSAAWLSVPYATECVNLTSSERPSKSS